MATQLGMVPETPVAVYMKMPAPLSPQYTADLTTTESVVPPPSAMFRLALKTIHTVEIITPMRPVKPVALHFGSAK